MNFSALFRFAVLVILLVFSGIAYRVAFTPPPAPSAAFPSDWLLRQRIFPRGEINYPVYRRAQAQAEFMQRQGIYRQVEWSFAGPSNVGGRITDLALSPTNFDTIYAAAASGGVFRTVDRGGQWTPVFDEELTLSIGAVALAPSRPNTVYVGTGEANAGGSSQIYGGYGVYKSSDAGQTWQHLGLEETRYIGRIVVDPHNPDRVFVAALGKLFNTNPERGVYRTPDGGETWERSLFINDSTGCVDLVMNPLQPNLLYAAMWERIRRPDQNTWGGRHSGIYRSSDGGDTWQELTNGLPYNSPAVGRIGITLCASQPQVLYAIYADNTGRFAGVYKTVDGGENWFRTNDTDLNAVYGTTGWWFGNIRVSPANPNLVFALGIRMYRSLDGGQSWQDRNGRLHVDQHAMYIHPQDPNYIVVGNDGGIYMSLNGGVQWGKSSNLPITQFYTGEFDDQFPERKYGGTQDNGTQRTLSGNPLDWHKILAADGFYVLVDPQDNQYVYAETQFGGLHRSTDGGYTFTSALSGIISSDRFNWSAPLAMDPSQPQTLYFGTHRVYRSNNRALSWTPISPDLSNYPHPGNLVFGTVTAIAVAPGKREVIYAGTDDGNVWISPDFGQNWQLISAELPVRWVTRVAVDPFDEHIAYVTFSGYRWEDFLPHIFRTGDAGQTWEDISGNLPEVPLNDVVIDPGADSTLYVASDVGVYFSQNLGREWHRLGSGLPNTPIMDLDLHQADRILLAATYGRSMYTLQLSGLTGLASHRQSISSDFRLGQNYPNPFNGVTHIPFRLARAGQVRLTIYDNLGRRVRTAAAGRYDAGEHSIAWDGRNEWGEPVGSGVYVYRLQVDNWMGAGKLTLVQ